MTTAWSMENLAASPLQRLQLALFFVFLAVLFSSSGAADSIDRAGSLRDGENLVSEGGRFALGFFTPSVSAKKHLCVRFNRGEEKPIVWVANRRRPLNTSAGVLRFGADGNLVLLDAGYVVWSTRLAPDASGSRVAQLLDSGKLVIRHAAEGSDAPTDDGGFLWQSFDDPGDTLLPGMKLLLNTRTGASRRLTSWAAAGNPSPGQYSYGVEVDILPRLVLREGPKIRFTTGLWNHVRFTGFEAVNANGVFNSTVVTSGDETYFSETMIENSSIMRAQLDPSGNIQRFLWLEETGTWSRVWAAPGICEQFAFCGPYGTCAEKFPPCHCLRGFRPRSPTDWALGKRTGGCVRTTKLGCGTAAAAADVFLPVQRVKLPEMNKSTVSMGVSLEACRNRCAVDCSCTAYAAAADLRDDGAGRGCITWSGDLVNMWNLTIGNQVFYLRVAASDLDSVSSVVMKKRSKQVAIVASASAVSGMLLLVLCGLWMKNKMNRPNTDRRKHHHNEMIDGEDMELKLFDFEDIISATGNFSVNNKIGEGGFGTVYKGVLVGGQEVAVKRLSWTSVQGMGEFMNEAKLIVKLQHKNLVRLLGCCTKGDERMLIFEYMQNKSLDFFIFDETRRALLGWRMRLDIILGIARGLLYLHHDSRFKIIHRDLKTSNILLDDAKNPKISDFGTAKIFGADQQTQKTRRVIGTYGYMSPEYAINGIISIKSDVFSFGVVVLEVLSGIRSRGMYQTEPHLNLLSYAWKLWQEGNCLQLLDPMVTGSFNLNELVRCIQVGLLCVQEHASDRPTMYAVVKMLDNENSPLSQPRKPGFLEFGSSTSPRVSSSRIHKPCTNEMTVTGIIGR